jgi:flavin reductase (DIM6/NTAB) family NADH-FMN oxidoreductase RutF
MDADIKKSTLRMIPYGLYVLTTEGSDGAISAATVNWATQTSFEPPLVALGVKSDSGAYAGLKSSGTFALNMLGKGQQAMAFAFFKPAQVDGDTISGEPFTKGETGAALLTNCPAAIECKVIEIVEKGDHHVILGQVINAVQSAPLEGRPDEAILEMKDLGEKTFYGG